MFTINYYVVLTVMNFWRPMNVFPHLTNPTVLTSVCSVPLQALAAAHCCSWF